MNNMKYYIDPNTNEFRPIRGAADQVKNDAEYIQAAKEAADALSEIGQKLEEFTDDFDIRSAYNQIYRAYIKLKVKHETVHST